MITAGQILMKLEKQKFADWYNGRFDDYISGVEEIKPGERLVEREKILADIERIFELEPVWSKIHP